MYVVLQLVRGTITRPQAYVALSVPPCIATNKLTNKQIYLLSIKACQLVSLFARADQTKSFFITFYDQHLIFMTLQVLQYQNLKLHDFHNFFMTNRTPLYKPKFCKMWQQTDKFILQTLFQDNPSGPVLDSNRKIHYCKQMLACLCISICRCQTVGAYADIHKIIWMQ